MLLPPRILSVGIIFIITFLLFIPIFFEWGKVSNQFVINYIPWALMFTVTAFSLIISVPNKFYNKKTLKAIIYIPWGFFLMVLSLLKIRGASKKFIHTTHSHNDTIKHN
jgi:hypothetical protein